jgi:hypothetical protein
MRIVLDDVASTYTHRLDSHRSSWARMVRCAVADMKPEAEVQLLFDGEWDGKYDQWVIVYPMEFTGKGVNMQGGPNPKVLDRLGRLADSIGGSAQIVSLERPLPDYNELVVKPRFKQDVPALSALTKTIPEVSLESVVRAAAAEGGAKPSVVLGDSHAASHYVRHALILRHDALTLYGALERRLEKMLPAWALDPDQCSGIKLVFGNIDVRHHLCRQDDPKAALRSLLDAYHAQVDDLARSSGQELTIVTPLPIEHEARRLPKTGWYKGAPFYGSREQRLDLVRDWWGWAHGAGIERECYYPTWHWPLDWYRMDGEEYAKHRMEKPNSVHLSPRWHLWDYETNEPNARLIDEDWGA